MFPLSIFCFYLLWYNLLNQAQTVQQSDQEHLHGDSAETLSAKKKKYSFKTADLETKYHNLSIKFPLSFYISSVLLNSKKLSASNWHDTRSDCKILEFQATSRPKNLTLLAYKTPLP